MYGSLFCNQLKGNKDDNKNEQLTMPVTRIVQRSIEAVVKQKKL